MRLIDADEIEYESVAKEERNGGFRATDIVEQKDIDEMPTIEAIPISFILEQIELLEKCESVWSAGTLRDLVLDWQKQEEAEQC